MKKHILFVPVSQLVLFSILLLIPQILHGQEGGLFDTSGVKYCDSCSIIEINKKLGNKQINSEGIYQGGNYLGRVTYEMLKNKPLIIDTEQKKNIPTILKLFKNRNYLRSSNLFWDIEKMIKANSLTTIYLIESIGKPDSAVTSFDDSKTIEIMEYSTLGLIVYCFNGNVYKYTRYSL